MTQQRTSRSRFPKGGPERLRLAACQRLLRWSIEKNQEWASDHDVQGPDLLLISMFSRSTRPYEEVVRHLGNHAFGEQGLMLNRALFEDMIDMPGFSEPDARGPEASAAR